MSHIKWTKQIAAEYTAQTTKNKHSTLQLTETSFFWSWFIQVVGNSITDYSKFRNVKQEGNLNIMVPTHILGSRL